MTEICVPRGLNQYLTRMICRGHTHTDTHTRTHTHTHTHTHTFTHPGKGIIFVAGLFE